MTMRKFKSGLFGYSKKSVETIVSTLASKHEQSKRELEALVGELGSGGQSAGNMTATDETERTRLVMRPRASLWGYRKGAVNQYIRSLHKYSDQELEGLRQKVAALQKTVAVKVSESELEVAASLTEAATIALVSVEEKPLVGALSPVEEQSPIEVQSLVEEAPLAEESPSPDAPPVQPAADARRTGNVVQFRRKSPTPTEATEPQPSQPSQELMEQSAGYWGEIQRYLAAPSAGLEASEPIASEPILGAASLASASSMSETVPAYFDYHLPEPAMRRSAPDRSPQRQPISRTPLKEPAKDKLKTEEPAQQPLTALTAITAPTAPTVSAAPPAPQSPAISSRGITEEVAQLRYKYILGKMTGKDLLTRHGRLIAAKNTPITRAVIDEADREGLLAELIIHMTILGIEVDEP
ncbi:MAG: hypothetical protein K0R75_2086 [Paenibacillaceae bacterium]|jgi:hypothetical protein|nr:hypothetical protein [Paenibacillaceae bacterium]